MGRLTAPGPKLAEVNCSRIRFVDGDRILVRIFQDMHKEQIARLRETVQKWAGADVHVLVINALKVDVNVG